MEKNLCIIGCGWLGQFVGEQLAEQFDNVFASYRSVETKEELERHGFIGFELDLTNQENSLPTDIISTTSVLIIALPPFDRDHPKRYGEALSNVASKFGPATRVFFTSSTGIYPSEIGDFDESFSCNENNVLCHAEIELKRVAGDRLTVLRLGGLIGGNRHPIKFLSAKHMSNSGEEPINLIHRSDIARLIDHLLKNNLFPGTLNVSYGLDMTKREYYDDIALKLGIPLPIWNSEPAVKRHISTKKLVGIKGFNLIFNPLEFTFE